MRPPCEIIVAAILPAIRSLLARELVEGHSMSQTKVAELLGTTQPAISQYISQKRGDQLTDALSSLPDVKTAIEALVKEITSDTVSQKDGVETICTICMSLRKDGTVCTLRQAKSDTPLDCDMCQSLSD
ncbi:MAG: transcriptional regulator [Candidatus Thorarchaeota archaeon]|jgi:predicted transcriptional regulator